MRFLSIPLALLLALPVPPPLAAQTEAPHLTIIVEQGEGAINNIKERTARETIVRVEDENHKPVAGAALLFTAPSQGAGGSFIGGGLNLNATTLADGRVTVRFHPNHVQGQFQIHVTASKDGKSGSTTINQTNSILAGAAAGAGAAVSTKLIVILAVAAAAATGGALYATHSGGGSSSSATIAPPITVTAGSGTVGPPH